MNKCMSHPTYKAILRPRVACEDCWRMYIDKYPIKLSATDKLVNEETRSINRKLDIIYKDR